MTEAEFHASEAGGQHGLSAFSVLRGHAAILLSVLLFGAGAQALYHLPAPLDLRQVMAGLRTTSALTPAFAVGGTGIGYLALVGYDWSALRYIGKRLPLPTVMLGGFLGYAFGNTIGLSAVSGGAVRYRICSALGLDGYDVAAIASFVAISCGVGGDADRSRGAGLAPGRHGRSDDICARRDPGVGGRRGDRDRGAVRRTGDPRRNPSPGPLCTPGAEPA